MSEEEEEIISPGDRWEEFRGRQPKGFISEFSKLLEEKVPNASKEFIELNTLVNLSAVCGKIVHLNNYSPIKANIFGLVIGPSGLGYKTIMMVKNGKELIKRIPRRVGIPQ